MGQRFFDVTMPTIADELGRLNASLMAIAKALSGSCTRQPVAPNATMPPPGSPAPVGASGLGTDVMAALAQIAREHLGIGKLEERKLDRLDFYDLGVTSIAAALRAAYEAGLAVGVSKTAH
jgi:hypothetical protein